MALYLNGPHIWARNRIYAVVMIKVLCMQAVCDSAKPVCEPEYDLLPCVLQTVRN
jgi:hypothetical protein